MYKTQNKNKHLIYHENVKKCCLKFHQKKPQAKDITQTNTFLTQIK